MPCHFDLVFCVDASAAMERELRRVTRMVMRLPDDVIEQSDDVCALPRRTRLGGA